MNNSELLKELEVLKEKVITQEKIIEAYERQRITDSIEFSNLIKEYNKILNSNTWKKTETIRKVLDKIKRITSTNIKPEEINQRERIYNEWINLVEKNIEIKEFDYNPLISIVMPIYNVDKNILKDAIDSVVNQLYINWELILVDDCSTNNCIDVLNIYRDNQKIKIFKNNKNSGISYSTNVGLKNATGVYVGFLDCDDVLSLNALQEVVKTININKDIKIVYSDYDLLSVDGKNKTNPFFKPDYSPDTLWWNNYISHFVLYRKDLIDKVGEFNSELDGSQDYDYILRAVENVDYKEIAHIDKVLYHWRTRKESVAFSNSAKPYAIDAAVKARNNAIKRRNIKGHLNSDGDINKIIYDDLNTGVSIIIPSKDNFDSLKLCIESIINITKYNNYEIIVVDNGSNEDNKKLISDYLNNNNIKYIYFIKPFNYSYMCNIGVKNSNMPVLCFLNDDIEITDENWLSIMVGQAIQKCTGAVGAKLYYPNSNLIQHCGVGNYLGGPGHYLQGMKDDIDHYYSRNKANYNVIAVTGACIVIEKDKFIEVNGYRQELDINYNDVDLCMRLYDNGYFNVVRNDVICTHHESLTRQPASVERLFIDRELLFKFNKEYSAYDPFYNRNLPQFSSNFDYERDLKIYKTNKSDM